MGRPAATTSSEVPGYADSQGTCLVICLGGSVNCQLPLAFSFFSLLELYGRNGYCGLIWRCGTAMHLCAHGEHCGITVAFFAFGGSCPPDK